MAELDPQNQQDPSYLQYHQPNKNLRYALKVMKEIPKGGNVTEDVRYYLNELFLNTDDRDEQIHNLIEMSF